MIEINCPANSPTFAQYILCSPKCGNLLWLATPQLSIADIKRIFTASTSFLFFPFESVLLKLSGKFLLLLLVHVAVQMFAGVAERRRHQDLSVLAQLISDSDQEVLQLHSIFKDLRVRPARMMEEGDDGGEQEVSKRTFMIKLPLA